MKIAIIIVRVLFGALLIFASVSYFFKLAPQPVLTGNNKIFMDGVNATVYLMPLIKIVELSCGIALLVGRFVALAVVVIFPIVLNIFFYHMFLGREQLMMGVIILLADLFLAYAYRKHYMPMLVSK